MPATIINFGTKGGVATVRFGNTGNVQFGQINAAGEVVLSAKIIDIYWSEEGGQTWDVDRGSNNILHLADSGRWNFYDTAIETESEQEANVITVTLSGGTGSLILKLKKKSSFTSEY